MANDDLLWQTKLAAWIHDPGEKALILLRGGAGHTGGTVSKLEQQLFSNNIPKDIIRYVKRADQWASAADRPQFPKKSGDRWQPWAQVRFYQERESILQHPLSGREFNPGEVDFDRAQLEKISFDHFEKLIVKEDGAVNWRKTALAFWRFGPVSPIKGLNPLWQLLPADTRVPDHTIWNHLDLTSALAGAFALDTERTPALLAVSFGPVQDFIAQTRSTSDLWAGSHLLSRLAWEGLRVICEHLGPDAVIYPQLRGVALVDLWLWQEEKLRRDWFKQTHCDDWLQHSTDRNPLFVAALPDKLVAIVPADQLQTLAETIICKVRAWVHTEGYNMVTDLLKMACQPTTPEPPCYQQARTQLAAFPEIHWAAVPWSLIQRRYRRLDTQALQTAQDPFFPSSDQGFLGSKAWELLSRRLRLQQATFYWPNHGVLYPALYELLERLAASAKTVRPFEQLEQHGYRCSLCGEREWLTTDCEQLNLPRGERQNTLWQRTAERRPAWARRGEHLCAPCALKRLWPNRFAESLRDVLGGKPQRFVVSTHTLALSTSLENWLNAGDRTLLPPNFASQLELIEDAVLPRKLAIRLYHETHEAELLARKLPTYLDSLRDALASAEPADREQAERCLRQTENKVAKIFGQKPEKYYALILMDGDHMGDWLKGSNPDYLLPYGATWHPKIREALAKRTIEPDLQRYLNEKRAASPARHIAISSAINSFALYLVPHIVEDLHKGKLLYAGGDDVMAMIAVDELLSTMLLLRLGYSGIFPGMDTPTPASPEEIPARAAWRWLFPDGAEPLSKALKLGNDHAVLQGRCYRMMGERATASLGAVVAHHTAPLGSVLRELRAAEQRAKQEGGRNAFSITVLKRSGGALQLTCPWLLRDQEGNDLQNWNDLTVTPMGRLIELRRALADPVLSRRVAYLAQTWLPQLPPASLFAATSTVYRDMIVANLAYQFQRQTQDSGRKPALTKLGHNLAELALALTAGQTLGKDHREPLVEWLQTCLGVAEFLARPGRVGTTEEED